MNESLKEIKFLEDLPDQVLIIDKFKYVFPLIGKDFVKMIFGLSVSVAIVLAIHYFIIPRGLF